LQLTAHRLGRAGIGDYSSAGGRRRPYWRNGSCRDPVCGAWRGAGHRAGRNYWRINLAALDARGLVPVQLCRFNGNDWRINPPRCGLQATI